MSMTRTVWSENAYSKDERSPHSAAAYNCKRCIIFSQEFHSRGTSIESSAGFALTSKVPELEDGL